MQKYGMNMTQFILNGNTVTVNVSADTPLLWVLRDHLNLTGTKYGCGKGLCGSCTVLFNGTATRSCLLPISAIEGHNITTIEGLDNNHPVKHAWIYHQVSQCGYCQPGQILSAVSLLDKNTSPSEKEIKDYMSGNICRCGTYPRIIQAIQSAAVHYHDATETIEPLEAQANRHQP